MAPLPRRLGNEVRAGRASPEMAENLGRGSIPIHPSVQAFTSLDASVNPAGHRFKKNRKQRGRRLLRKGTIDLSLEVVGSSVVLTDADTAVATREARSPKNACG